MSQRLARPQFRFLTLLAVTGLAATASLAQAQGTTAPPGVTTPAMPATAPAPTPSADITRAISRDTTDTAIQNNWNSIIHPAPAKPAETPADKPAARRGHRGGAQTGISSN
ncbi:hypothetical protein PTE30175_02871 [Pandoraea terrae]|uniref:Uncharacterized protein n=1 Tax=Pandoraea terrae TaxID=1537710 RepID=A0A5E4W0T3_9BURK|nr:hypothetical protein [Pandoraea terrae]VVE17429.1 hypothetical protein PTE30175_02871 [Pandoraea terrae]